MSSDRTRLTPDRPAGRDPFGLRSLPDAVPPEPSWPVIAARLAGERPRRRPWLWPAAAALLAACLGLIVLLQTELATRERELDRWIAYSQRLESELAAVREEGSILRGHEAVAVTELEDLVSVVDRGLASAPAERALGLWQQRTALLSDLVTVHARANRNRWQPDDRPVPVVTRHLPSTAGTVPLSDVR